MTIFNFLGHPERQKSDLKMPKTLMRDLVSKRAFLTNPVF